MTKRDRGRFGRLFGRDGSATGDESVPLSGNDDHAWWADRRTLTGAPIGAQSSGLGEDEDAEPDTRTEPDPWSVEALFADAGFDPYGTPPPPPPVDDGSTTVVVTTGLDEARLVLGVSSDSTWDDITRAHRSLAKQFHPDRLGDLSLDAQELGQHRMAEINRAYNTLRDHLPV